MRKVQKNYITTFILLTSLVFSLILTTSTHQVKNIIVIDSRQETDLDKSSIITVEDLGPDIQRGAEVREEKHVVDEHEIINKYVRDICLIYNYKIEPEFVMSVIQQESEYIPTVKNGDCVGLMQVSRYWHSKRAEKLGITDFYDPYSNILLGVDYLTELLDTYKDPALVLMLYNMKHADAFRLYSEGKISDYAKTILAREERLKKGEHIGDVAF